MKKGLQISLQAFLYIKENFVSYFTSSMIALKASG